MDVAESRYFPMKNRTESLVRQVHNKTLPYQLAGLETGFQIQHRKTRLAVTGLSSVNRFNSEHVR